MSGRVFVFGSNLAGRHGKGAALYAALYHSAERGVGEGLTGTAYALPTKDEKLRTLPLEAVKEAIGRFVDFARSRPDLTFELTPIGCGLAGFDAPTIACTVLEALSPDHDPPRNIVLAPSWLLYVIKGPR